MDKRLIAEARLARGAFIASVVFSLLDGGLIIGQALILSRIINRAFLGSATASDLRGLFLALLGIIGLRALNRSAIQLSSAEVAIRIKEVLRKRLNDQIVALGPAFTSRERSGELATAATNGIEALDSFFREYLPALFISVLVPLAILVVVLPLDLLTFVVMLVTAPLIPVFMVLIGWAAGSLARSQYGQLGRMSAHFLDVMQGLSTLKLFSRSKAQITIIQRITDRFRESSLGVLRVAFLSAFALELLATISVAVVAVEIGLRLLAGGLPFEEAFFLLVIAPEFYMPLRQLGAKFHSGQDGTAAADRIFSILDIPLPARTGGKTIQVVQAIRFEAVSFAYGERSALQSVSFEIRNGQRVALVGATGSGKSTVAALLLSFVQPDSGRIMISDGSNEYDLRDLDIDQWRELVAWVPQRGYLFNVSVAENIRVADPAASDQQVIEAAKLAEAHTFIEALPDGYDTVTGENATRLSGGQAQRIALARALIRKAALTIFDEATANLDSDTESRIMHNLAGLPRDGIRLTIAHHLETVTDADLIYVLDGGRMSESGAHHDLIRQQGAYYHLLLASGSPVDG